MTSHIMRQSVTAIRMVVFSTGGISITNAFGVTEWIDLNENFYVVFRELFQVDLCQCCFASDQGPTLMSIGKRHRRHLICFRHFLLSLKQKQFGCEGAMRQDSNFEEM
jgi:hypothetical protein